MGQNLQLQEGLKLQELMLQQQQPVKLSLQELQQQVFMLAHQVLKLQHQVSELLEWQLALILGEAQGEAQGEEQGEAQEEEQGEEQVEGSQATLMPVAISKDVFQLLDYIFSNCGNGNQLL